jgi:hypothetical protein
VVLRTCFNKIFHKEHRSIFQNMMRKTDI